jgi:hypothetical protein
LRIFVQILVFFFFASGLAEANTYRFQELLKLGKDEQKKFLVKYGNNQKIFEFRWTLRVGDSLVVLRSYDRIVGQNVLHLAPKRDSFRVPLKPYEKSHAKPYILVKYVEYDFELDKAVLMLFLSDENMQVSLEDLEGK